MLYPLSYRRNGLIISCYNARMWYIYMVRCIDTTLYTGVTTDPVRRLREHNGEINNGASYTKLRRPVVLVYTERAATRSHAMKRERAIKHLSKQQKERLISAVSP
jgi:putative endonuclease